MKTPSSAKSTLWREHILKATQHPGGVQSYLGLHRLSPSSFYNWKIKLSNLNSVKKESKKAGPFLPVVLSDRVPQENQALDKNLPDPKWVALFLVSFLKELS